MRIIAFGCSMTYGHGLEDCCIGYEHKAAAIPSKFAWPNLLAEKLNAECVNLSHPGSSNKAITKRLLEFQYQSDDIIFVLWTFKNRTAVFYKEDVVTDVGHWTKNPKLRRYYDYFYSDTEGEWDFQTKSFLCKMFLDSLGVKNFHMVLNKNSIDHLYAWNKTTYLPLYFQDMAIEMKSKAKDHVHPGPEAHRKFADELSKVI